MKSQKISKVKKSAAVSKKVEEVTEPSPPIKTRRPWYIALLVAGSLLLIMSIVLAVTGVLDEWERRAFHLINHAYLPGWVAAQIAKPLSNAVWGMAFLVTALLVIPKFRLVAWQYAVAAGSTYAGVFILEHLVDRARPIGLASYEVVARASQDGPGFPSGHIAVLSALVLAVWPFLGWPWRIFLLLLIAVEAWARIFLGVHAPLDIVGGLAVAMSAVAVIHLLPAKIRDFFKLRA